MTLHKRPLHADDLQQQRQVLQQRLLQSNSGEDIPILNFLDAQVCCVPLLRQDDPDPGKRISACVYWGAVLIWERMMPTRACAGMLTAPVVIAGSSMLRPSGKACRNCFTKPVIAGFPAAQRLTSLHASQLQPF